ncbi:Calcium-binding protein CML37 [Acorus calamus]|uniref:Calcium-binding protein CML37 n=1 Tax=Acorus calamus TaxID=4465 RepID=A0AAV9CEC4_ACOCL|nr:Calcium-binding protein CML37 [Acorus calamus]
MHDCTTTTTTTTITTTTTTITGAHRFRDVFQYLDADHDGRISGTELDTYFKAVGNGKATMDDDDGDGGAYDVDGDGTLDFEEFKRMMA